MSNNRALRILICVLVVTAFCFFSLVAFGSIPAQAAGTGKSGGTPSGDGSKTGSAAGKGGSVAPSSYLSELYRWFLGFVGIAALFAIVYGGVIYMFSGTSLTQTSQAKRWIQNGIWGIVLAAASVLILQTINPDLVKGGFDITTLLK